MWTSADADREGRTTMMIDRSAAAQALAKAIAYANCGKDDLADEWARKLVTILGSANILKVTR